METFNMQQIEAYRHQAQLAAEAFEETLKWNVRMVKPEGNTIPLKEKSKIWIVCGDGRYTELLQNEALAGQTVALFGGGYALLELKFGGTQKGMHEALALARSKGFDLRLHGDMHGEHNTNSPFGCGNLGKWEAGAIPGVKPLEITRQQMLDIARSMGIQLDILKGHHEETALHLNYAPGTSVISSVDHFRTDAWVAQLLGLPDVAAFSRQTVELLGPVRDVTIIEP
jgi:hypothetical protein